MNIILLSGYAGSGKSLAAACIQALRPEMCSVAFADPIKDAVAIHFNIPRHLCDTQEGKASIVNNSGLTVRDLLIEYSAEEKKTRGDAVFVDAVVAYIQNTPTTLAWIIHDWRYPTEYTTLRGAFPQATIHRIRIVRTNVQSLPIPSEHGLDTYEMDHIIYNDGTLDDLLNKISTILPKANA